MNKIIYIPCVITVIPMYTVHCDSLRGFYDFGGLVHVTDQTREGATFLNTENSEFK